MRDSHGSVESVSPTLSLLRNASRLYLEARFPDPVQRAAQRHLHDSTSRAVEKMETFLLEKEEIRVQVLMELRLRAELNSPGNVSPALSTLFGSIAVAATLFGTLVFALVNGWFGTVVKMTNADTGVVVGLTQQSFDDTVSALAEMIATVATVVVLLSSAAITHARARDQRRAAAVSWLARYTEALADEREARQLAISDLASSSFVSPVSSRRIAPLVGRIWSSLMPDRRQASDLRLQSDMES